MDEATKPNAARKYRHEHNIYSQKQHNVIVVNSSDGENQPDNDHGKTVERAKSKSSHALFEGDDSPHHSLAPSDNSDHPISPNMVNANEHDDEDARFAGTPSESTESQPIVLGHSRKGTTTAHSKSTTDDTSVEISTETMNRDGTVNEPHQDSPTFLGLENLHHLELEKRPPQTLHDPAKYGFPSVMTPVTVDRFAQLYTKAWESLIQEGRALNNIQRYADSYIRAWEDSAKLVKNDDQPIHHIQSDARHGDNGADPELDASFGSGMMAMEDLANDETQYLERDARVIQESQYCDGVDRGTQPPDDVDYEVEDDTQSGEGDTQPMDDDTQPVENAEDSEDEEDQDELQQQSVPTDEESTNTTTFKDAVLSQVQLSSEASKVAKPFCQTAVFRDGFIKKVTAQNRYSPLRARVLSLAADKTDQSSGTLQRREGSESNEAEEFYSASENSNTASQPKSVSRPLKLRLNFTPKSNKRAARLSKSDDIDPTPIQLEYPGMITGEWLETLQSLTQEVNRATSDSQKQKPAAFTPTAKRRLPSKGHFQSPKSAPSSQHGHVSKFRIITAANSSQRRVTSAQSVFEDSQRKESEPLKGILKNKRPAASLLKENNPTAIATRGPSRIPENTNAGAFDRNRHVPNASNNNANDAAFRRNSDLITPHESRANNNAAFSCTRGLPPPSQILPSHPLPEEPANTAAFSHNRNVTPPPRPSQDEKIFNSGGCYDDDELNRNANTARRIIGNSPLGARFRAPNPNWNGVTDGMAQNNGHNTKGDTKVRHEGEDEEQHPLPTPLATADAGILGEGECTVEW
ncbi:MAG: hypothetical protein M1831_006622 [Alyxoria varia]|nr:MAG: hypothetical protein M1831_006622 [Alyxoria varia]